MPTLPARALWLPLILFLLPVAGLADDTLSFRAPFDGSARAIVAEGGSPEPTAARGLRFVPGLSGQAVYVGQHGQGPYEQMPLLEYEAGRHFSGEGGTVMFWVSPDWDGYFTDPVKFDWYFLFAAMGGQAAPDFTSRDVAPNGGADRIWLFMWNWLRCDLYGEAGKPPASLAWRCRNTWLRGDWWHVAFTWSADGWGKLYVNGLPQATQARPKLKDIQRFYVGSLPRVWTRDYRANAAFDELQIYRRALANEEIAAEFRRFAPLDFTLERRYLTANAPEQLALELTRGPGLTAPVTGSLAVRVLADADGRVVAQRQYPLQVAQQRQTVVLPLGRLAVGAYRAECTLGGGCSPFRRSFPLTVYAPQPAPPVSAAEVKLGQRLVSIDCTEAANGLLESAPSTVKSTPGVGTYREAGAGKWDRFGYEVSLPGADGSPVMLELSWPDDRERAMGVYMLPKAPAPRDRDRLSGGIQCGGEYPTSGTMQKVRYLFYPAEEQYLLEVRTLVPGLPAAAAKLEIYRLAERLPRLGLGLPAGLRGRAFGHLDEDQSFEVLFGGPQDSRFPRHPLPHGYPIQVAERLLDYLDYTGQNVISYSLARYTWTHLDEGPVNTVGDGMRTAGWVDLFLDTMARRDKQLLANINLFTVPEKGSSPDLLATRVKHGYYLLDRRGKPFPLGGEPGLGDSPLHPLVRARFLEIIGEMLRHYGRHPAFRGLDLWCEEHKPCLFGSLDYGYDDLTIAAFARETGVSPPTATNPEERFEARYRDLTGPHRAQWLAWRARKNTELLGEIAALMHRTRPDLQLYLTLGGWYSGDPGYLDREQCEDFAFGQFAYEHLGLDLAALKRLPPVVLVPLEDGTFYRWLKHWYGGRESITNELNHDVTKFRVFRNGARSGVSIYLRYFESFMESLKQETYPGYFQNCDPKAHGRYFLQDFAVALASEDAAQILVGAQPLGTTGRDAEAREFAAAYRALPVGDFREVAGLRDPVTARYLNTRGGTYLYAVNLLWSPVTATIALPAGAGTTMDLSTGEPVAVRAGRLEVLLKPFQLRSFRLTGRTAKPSGGPVSVPEATRGWYDARVREVAAEVEALTSSGATPTAHQQRLALIRRQLEAGRFAEAHRLLFSKLMRGLPEYRRAAAGGFLKESATMIARSQYAVDCGSLAFYRAKSGRLFAPDRKYAPGGYGYDGGYQSVTRGTQGLLGSDDPELFATEAYNLDAYRFTVKPGRYTVRLYLKVGYEPGARPGVFVFNVDLEGRRALQDFDVMAACGNDFRRVAIQEWSGIEVRDGVLDVEFSLPAGGTIDPTARLCDAIEVMPEGGK